MTLVRSTRDVRSSMSFREGQVKNIAHTPEMKEILDRQGFEAQTSTPEEFAALIRRGIEQTTKLIELLE